MEQMFVVMAASAGAFGAGAIVAWLVRAGRAAREIGVAEENWQREVARAETKSRLATDQTATLKLNLEETRQLLLENKHAAVSNGTELECAKQDVRVLTDRLAAAQTALEELKHRQAESETEVRAAKRRVLDLKQEFDRSKTFYKGQIGTAVEKRLVLERQTGERAREIRTLEKRLAATRAERERAANELASARAELGKLEHIEQRSMRLEADNAELRHLLGSSGGGPDPTATDDAGALRLQQRSLAQSLALLQGQRWSRPLDAPSAAAGGSPGADDPAPPSAATGDDLTEIIGIGKAFEAKLHELGIYYYRQIAGLRPEEFEKAGAELHEFRGRIESDDWIGQARRLHRRKYGVNGTVTDLA